MTLLGGFLFPRKRQPAKAAGRRKTRLGQYALGRRGELLEDRCMLSVSSTEGVVGAVAAIQSIQASPVIEAMPSMFTAYAHGLSPDQIRNAYGYSSIPTVGGGVVDGAGQTIAIVVAYSSPTIFSDVDAFDQQYSVNSNGNYSNLYARYGASASFLTVVNQSGQTSPLPAANFGWAAEISLDVEWAHATAPGAKILLVEANSLAITTVPNGPSTCDLFTAVDTARNWPGVSVVSMSWGFTTTVGGVTHGAEYPSETFDDFHFTTPAGHNPVTFVAASGDYGIPASYPAFSPNVVSVGGTSLSTNSNGAYLGESGWSGSGGGQSAYETEPLYQGVVQHSNYRTTPDISLNAGNLMSLYDSYQQLPSLGNWGDAVGTSFGAPMWSAIVAMSNEERAIANLPSLDGPHETLPRLYSMPVSYFHDITTGNNGTQATAGYDEVTGIGSPHVNSIVPSFIQTLNPTVTWFANGAQVAEVADNVNPGWQDLFVVGGNGLVREDQYNTATHIGYGQSVIDTSTVFAAGTKIVAYNDGASLNLFAVGTDGHVKWAQQKNGGQWTNFTTIDANSFTFTPGEGLWGFASPGGYFFLYGVGTDGYVKQYTYSSSQNRWTESPFGHDLYFNPGTPLSGWYDPTAGNIQVYGQLANGDIGEWLATSSWTAHDIVDAGAQFPSPAGGLPGIPLLVVSVNSWTDIFGVTTSGNVGLLRVTSLSIGNGGGTLSANNRYVSRSAIAGTEYANGTTVLFGADAYGDITEVQYSGGWTVPVIYPATTYVPGSQVTFVVQQNGTWEILGVANNGDLLDEEHAAVWNEYDLH